MKQAAFHAMAEFYQSCVCKDARSYGEQIARLQVIQSYLFFTVGNTQDLFFDYFHNIM
jgi:hypothetical protein